MSRIYNDAGKLLISEVFVKGKVEGRVLYYSKKGRITEIDTYEDDKLKDMIFVLKRTQRKGARNTR
jgi:antitoxin component YwqK of YwqJK toxin-antitoxin module